MTSRPLRLAPVAAALAFAAAPAAHGAALAGDVEVAGTRPAPDCQDAPRAGAGVGLRRVRAAAGSLVVARLRAARGDWDLAVFDAEGGRVAASSGFGARELAVGFARRGGELVVQACRLAGDAASARLDVTTVPLPARRGRLRLVRIAAPSPADRDRLAALGIDLAEHGGRGWVEAVAQGDDLRRLRAAGFSWRVVAGDLARRLAANVRRDVAYAAGRRASALPSGRTSYRRLADYEADMKRLAQERADLVRPVVASVRSLEGRPIAGIEISEDVHATGDGKPVFLMLGVHHAREWPSGEHTIEFAHDLVRNFGADERITGLLRRVRVLVVPVVNVDGFNVSREAAVDLGDLGRALGGETGYSLATLIDPFLAYKRRNCRLLGTLPTIPGLCALAPSRLTGVDLNRNYGAFWGGPGASALPLWDTYRGAAPFSEPETRAIRELVSQRQVTVLITNHTFANLLLRPPGLASQGTPPDEPAMKALGDAMAEANGYTSQQAWELYDTTGTTEDWSYAATGGYGFTFEIGPNEFHPPFEEVVAEYLGTTEAARGRGGNREAFLRGLEAAADPRHHAVITGRAPAGTTLRLHKEVTTGSSPVRPFETDLVGDPIGLEGDVIVTRDRLTSELVVGPSHAFTWHVNPSTRPAVVAAGGTEAWTLSCLGPDGRVVAEREVVVGRGERVDLGQACSPALLAPASAADRRVRAAISRRTVRAERRGRAVTVVVSCPRAARARCAGTLELATRVRSRGRARTVVLGRKRYALRAGTRRTVRVVIRRAQRRLLRSGRTLRVRATAIGADDTRRTVTIRVRPARR